MRARSSLGKQYSVSVAASSKISRSEILRAPRAVIGHRAPPARDPIRGVQRISLCRLVCHAIGFRPDVHVTLWSDGFAVSTPLYAARWT